MFFCIARFEKHHHPRPSFRKEHLFHITHQQHEAKMVELKEYTADEIAKHTTEDDCWMIIGNETNGRYSNSVSFPKAPNVEVSVSLKAVMPTVHRPMVPFIRTMAKSHDHQGR